MEVARRMRSQRGPASTRLVALTGYGQQEERARSRDAGFEAHLIKPIDIEQLNRCCARLPHKAHRSDSGRVTHACHAGKRAARRPAV